MIAAWAVPILFLLGEEIKLMECGDYSWKLLMNGKLNQGKSCISSQYENSISN